MRATAVIAKALSAAWLGNRRLTPNDVIKDLAEHGWYLVQVKREVTEELDDGYYPFTALRERISVDVEGEGVYDESFWVSRKFMERAHEPQKMLAHGRRDLLVKLALNIAKRKGWLDEDPS